MTVAKLVLFGKGSCMSKSEDLSNRDRSLKHVRSMVFSAMLMAISVLLTRFVSPQIGNAFRLSFGSIPIMLAGIAFGPVYGFIVGIAADLIGCFVNLMGTGGIIPGLVLCSGLLGAVTPLLYNNLFKRRGDVFLAITLLVTEVVVSGLLKSAFLTQAYGGSYLVWLVPKLVNAFAMAAIEFAALKVLLKVWSRLEKK